MEQRSRAALVAGGQSGAEEPAEAPLSAPAGEGEKAEEQLSLVLLSIGEGLTPENTLELFWDSGHFKPITSRARPASPSTSTTLDHMDFKANLKGVKAKTEEARKGNPTQQMDFRAVLGKKGDKPASKPSDMLTKTDADFRSVLTNKKNLVSPEKNQVSPEKNGEKDMTAVNNCVKEEMNEKMSRGAGKVPQFVEKLDDLTVVDGQRLRLQCRLPMTDPTGLTVTWTLDGKVIKPSKFIILANEGQRLCRPNAPCRNYAPF